MGERSRASVVFRDPEGRESEVPLVESLTLGRSAENEIVVNDQNVSRRHACIMRDDHSGFVVADLGSVNGTIVNGRPIQLPCRLRNGDVIQIGSATLRFVDAEEAPPPYEDPPTAAGATVPQQRPERVILGASQKMVEVFRLLETAAASPIPVLLEGETGTGKELIARGIHSSSSRAKSAFVAINCAALNESLLESELFGHRRGAFTGAVGDHKGLFEAASGGTIFLDEIGEMPLSLQAKLLRVLEESEVMPVGETKPRRVDIRVISATNRDLGSECETGRFRHDLFFRLATFPIRLPALRERREDIGILAKNALSTAALRHGKRIPGISADALNALGRFHWPGNVRELRNEIQRAVALARDGEPIGLKHLSEKIVAMAVPPGSGPSLPAATSKPIAIDVAASTDVVLAGIAAEPAAGGGPYPLREARMAFEARYIAQVYEQCGRRVGATADALGLSRVALSKKLKDYKIR